MATTIQTEVIGQPHPRHQEPPARSPLLSASLSTIEAKTQRLQLMGKRLSGLRSQDALCLLHHSFAIPKVLFILWSYGVPFLSKLKMMLVFTIHAGIYDAC